MGKDSEEKEKKNKDEKRPYNPYGYNTPDKTNFSETVHTEEIILAADKAAGEKYEESFITVDDFQLAKKQLAQDRKIADQEAAGKTEKEDEDEEE